MRPFVEAFVLVERVEQTEDGRPVLYGIYGPVLTFARFPSNPFDMHLYTRLREVQSIEDALELEVVMSYGKVDSKATQNSLEPR